MRIDAALEDLQRALGARTAIASDVERVHGLVSAACKQAGRNETPEAREIERLFVELETRRAQQGDTLETFAALRRQVANVIAQRIAPGSTVAAAYTRIRARVQAAAVAATLTSADGRSENSAGS